MIMFFRRLGESWFFKVILFVIALSMVSVWGISDLISRIGKKETMIKVGSEKVSSFQLAAEFDKTLQQMRRRGINLTTEQALSAGLLDQTVASLTDKLLNREISEELGTIAGDDAVSRYIVFNPVFQSVTGEFDRNIFSAYLGQQGLSEEEFIKEARQILANNHMNYAVDAVVRMPKELSAGLLKYQNEKRDVSYVTVSADEMIVTDEPSEERLREYYEAEMSTLVTPERRDATYIEISPNSLKSQTNVSEQEIEKAYEEKKVLLSEPEKRRVDQIKVDTESEALSLSKILTADNFIEKASSEAGQTPEETDFGWVEKESVMEELAAPLFSSPVNKVIGPIQSSLGYHFLVVREITAAKEPSKADLQKAVREQLETEKAYDLMDEKVRLAQNMIGEGKSLHEVAQALNLPEHSVEKISFVTQNDGVLSNPQFVQMIFSSSLKETTPLVEEKDGYLIAYIENIYPQEQKSFYQSRPELLQIWKKDEQKRLLSEKAQRMQDSFEQGKSFETVLKKENLKSSSLKEISRNSSDDLSQSVTEALFEARLKNPVILSQGDSAFIAAVVENISSEKTASSRRQMEEELQRQRLAKETVAEIKFDYADRLNVVIEHEEIDALFSVSKEE
jgi:peptidyl-prolyl cis-trans isomerase D